MIVGVHGAARAKRSTEQLVGAAVDPEAAGTEITGPVPAAVREAARDALRGAPAVLLESAQPNF